MTAPKLFIGIGSHHGMDRLGWLVAEELESKRLKDLDIRLAPTPYAVLDWLEGYQEVHLCDCCQAESLMLDQPPVTVQHWSWPTAALQSNRVQGTHDISVVKILELASQLQLIRGPIHIWGIQVAFHAEDLPTDTTLITLAKAAANQLSETAGFP